MGEVMAVCISEKKGTRKHTIEKEHRKKMSMKLYL